MVFRRIIRLGFPALILLSFILTACAGVQQVVSTPSPTHPPITSLPTPSTQYEIRAQDSGKTFTYTVTTRFTVILDQNQYPKSDLSCSQHALMGR